MANGEERSQIVTTWQSKAKQDKAPDLPDRSEAKQRSEASQDQAKQMPQASAKHQIIEGIYK